MDSCCYIRKCDENNKIDTLEGVFVILDVFAPDNINWEKQDGEMAAPHDTVFEKEGLTILWQ